jgi:hypothetical protein
MFRRRSGRRNGAGRVNLPVLPADLFAALRKAAEYLKELARKVDVFTNDR